MSFVGKGKSKGCTNQQHNDAPASNAEEPDTGTGTVKEDNEHPTLPPMSPLSPLSLGENYSSILIETAEEASKTAIEKDACTLYGLGITDAVCPDPSPAVRCFVIDPEEFERLKERHEKQIFRESINPPPRHEKHHLKKQYYAKKHTTSTVTPAPALELSQDVKLRKQSVLQPTYSQEYPNLRPTMTQPMQTYYEWDYISSNIEVITRAIAKRQDLEQEIDHIVTAKGLTNAPTQVTSVSDVLYRNNDAY